MSSRNPVPAQPRPQARPLSSYLLRGVLAIASTAALVLTLLAGSASLALDSLTNKVTTVEMAGETAAPRADFGDLTAGPLNILLLGSDKRTGKGNTGHGYFEGERSDTAMLLHVSGNRRHALVISIPRDTEVRLAQCTTKDGRPVGGYTARFNAAYYLGGPACSAQTLEQISGLSIPHFVVLDFNGFKQTIQALGGVEVCLTHPIDDNTSDIHLPAGRTRITGATALDFVRVRHGVGDGSDLGRISRQQLFVSSLLQEVTRSQLVTNPVRLWHVLEASAKSLKTDAALADPRGILAMAQSLASIRPENINFVTLPWVLDASGNTVTEDTSKSAPMWDALQADQTWPEPAAVGVDGKRLTVKPSAITVDVYNATGQKGTRATVVSRLRLRGYHPGRVANAPRAAGTVIAYHPDQLDAARTLQAAVADATLRQDADLGSAIALYVGADYQGIRALTVRPKKPTRDDSPTNGTRGDEVTTADDDICSS